MKTLSNIDLQLITNSTSSNLDGDALYNFFIDNAINNEIILHINGNLILSTSFLNSSFGRFIDNYGLPLFKNNIKIKTNNNTFKRLKDYIDIYSTLYANS